ncbi:hypothetical protein [Pseudonocardia sp. WMMC193]|uniref:hypothetical protein n=1 Tax=Pseudonocardia sp. WMMC193 TaxID=2911965 RepID=UPI001F26ED31|nr:hypothetical protein [Pseudonocardia sp. WMMC193]MCF7551994.1 hypothetical protein [Pseudonocardia sp. WMMC193]
MESLVHPHRYADALSARRSELQAQRRAAAAPRAALRAELALVTVASRAELPVALRVLRESSAPWLRVAPARLPALLEPALAALRSAAVGSVRAEGEAAVRRVAGSLSGLDPIPAALLGSAVAGPHPGLRSPGAGPVLPALPPRVGWVEALVRSGGGGAVRVALVLAAGAPALGLTVAGGRVLLPLTVGLAVAAVALLAVHRRRAVARERWARWVDAALGAASAGVRAELDTALLTLEQRAGPVLDRLAADRRAAIVHELRTLGGAEDG